jgi:hypothetical protein
VRTNFQIYDGLPIAKVEQISQGDGYVKVGVDLKHTNKILIVKVEQIKHKKRNVDLKDNVRIIVIVTCIGEIDINLKWGDFLIFMCFYHFDYKIELLYSLGLFRFDNFFDFLVFR